MTAPHSKDGLRLRLRVNANINEELGAFESFLKAKGLKLTGPRRSIARRALEAEQHFTAEDLVAALRRRGTGEASGASVYRTLTLLTEAKLLEAHDFAWGKTYYEPIYGVPHHDHLICIGCGLIIEFQNPEIERQQTVVLRREGFTMVSHSHKIYGLCRSCQLTYR